jgi:hypothetical protein
MSVTSVTAGTGGVTITGPVTQPVVNAPVSINNVLAGDGISISGTASQPTVALTSPLVLSQPLTLSSVLPVLPTQLGYTANVTLAGGSLVTNTALTMGSIVVGPGVYLVSANVTIIINSSTTVTSIQLIHSAPATSSAPFLYNLIPYPASVFSSTADARMVLSGVISVSEQSTFSLQAAAVFTGVGCTVSTRSYTVTRIA